jgi:hypothetical protein
VRVEVAGAPVHLEDLVAGLAEKVVVVVLPSDLVSRGLAGDVDGCKGAGPDHGVDRPVHGGEPEAGHD